MQHTGVVYFETSDAARTLNISTGMIRRLVEAGRLRVAAETVRGGKLFAPRDVHRLRQARAARDRA